MYIIETNIRIKDGYKECTKCHRILPISAFHKYSFGKKGPRAECIECERVRNALARANKNMQNPDYWKNYMKDWYHNKETPEQREQRLNRYKKFRQNNPNYMKEYYYKYKNSKKR